MDTYREDLFETKAGEAFVSWLRDAHAMEQQAQTMLTGMIGRLDSYPDLRARLQQHLRETESHEAIVARCLEQLGEGNSSVKDILGKAMATGQALSGLFASDEVMKGALAGATFEAMEINSYTSLIAAAEYLGLTDIAAALTPILRQEEDMAGWMLQNLPALTQRFLSKCETDEQAKR